jgi:hypothetical protein
MNLAELARELKLEDLTPQVRAAPGGQISAGYASDLLSDVLANAPRGGVLVTVQVHLNVVAVAVHAELAAVIFASGRRPEPAVIAKAAEEGVALYVSDQTAFDVVGRLYALGLRGKGR